MPFALLAQTNTKTTENTTDANVDYKQMDAPMPPLMFMAYQSSTVSNTEGKHSRKKKKAAIIDSASGVTYTPMTGKNLNSNSKLLVMMFNPTCSHCEDVTANIRDHIDLFKKTQVVLLANSLMRGYIPDFVERLRIANTPNIYIGYDSYDFVNKLFLYQSLPQINIYSADRKLLKTYCGEVPIDSLKRFIE
jgi:thiol-disulfide isomerase/thioredoxin